MPVKGNLGKLRTLTTTALAPGDFKTEAVQFQHSTWLLNQFQSLSCPLHQLFWYLYPGLNCLSGAPITACRTVKWPTDLRQVYGPQNKSKSYY
jgi:hypothetical protein